MKVLKTFTIILVLSGLSGCQNMWKTMVAHISIDNQTTFVLAKANAYTNVCLSEKILEPETAFAFGQIASQYLDLVVYDIDFYKKTYETELHEPHQRAKQGNMAGECREFGNELPNFTAKLRVTYNNTAQRLGRARAEENRQLIDSMSNLRLPSTPMPSPSAVSPSWGGRTSHPSSQNYLVNTNNGLKQCTVTSSNYVLCY